jgi:hypothetical protein
VTSEGEQPAVEAVVDDLEGALVTVADALDERVVR